MDLPLVNQFLIPHQVWHNRSATQVEINSRLADVHHIFTCFEPVQVSLIDTIDTPDKSVSYLAQNEL